MSETDVRIVDLVLGPPRRNPLGAMVLGLCIATLVHGALVMAASTTDPGLAPWAEDIVAKVRAELANEQRVTVEPPPTPKPLPPVEAPKAEPDVPKVATKAEPPPSRPRAPPPTGARPPRGNPAAPAPGPSGPVDFGDAAFPAGLGTPDGVEDGGDVRALREPLRPISPPTPPQRPKPAIDRSRPVALAEDDWTCPWPSAADDAQVDREIAIVKVTVGVGGRPEAARVVKDPGFGFGAAAVRCAMQARYRPALDADGRVVRAESPPIRVDFSR